MSINVFHEVNSSLYTATNIYPNTVILLKLIMLSVAKPTLIHDKQHLQNPKKCKKQKLQNKMEDNGGLNDLSSNRSKYREIKWISKGIW